MIGAAARGPQPVVMVRAGIAFTLGINNNNPQLLPALCEP